MMFFYVLGGCLWLCCVFCEQVWASRISTITPTKVIAYDIHVTIVFPSDTDTPGLRKPACFCDNSSHSLGSQAHSFAGL
ncbi:hypothetical protein HID58_015405 [Brassica napus]|uniref:Secreted protein n=1 Tax=Brassica napus TaxID=3708 RepID=A0ABQ8DLP2_BRANA|nr:hypothetical protein HID58_015405 [Brassica napus]